MNLEKYQNILENVFSYNAQITIENVNMHFTFSWKLPPQFCLLKFYQFRDHKIKACMKKIKHKYANKHRLKKIKK